MIKLIDITNEFEILDDIAKNIILSMNDCTDMQVYEGDTVFFILNSDNNIVFQFDTENNIFYYDKNYIINTHGEHLTVDAMNHIFKNILYCIKEFRDYNIYAF